MREIKFRGKREDNGEWVFGSFIPDALEGSNSDLVSWGFIRRYNRCIGKMEMIEVDRGTVGQYTGLKDKNGKEIYEGDIVLMECHATFQTKRQVRVHKCEVVFDIDFHGWRFPIIDIPDLPGGAKRAAQGFFRMGYRGNQVEVIGNIHEQEKETRQ